MGLAGMASPSKVRRCTAPHSGSVVIKSINSYIYIYTIIKIIIMYTRAGRTSVLRSGYWFFRKKRLQHDDFVPFSCLLKRSSLSGPFDIFSLGLFSCSLVSRLYTLPRGAQEIKKGSVRAAAGAGVRRRGSKRKNVLRGALEGEQCMGISQVHVANLRESSLLLVHCSHTFVDIPHVCVT